MSAAEMYHAKLPVQFVAQSSRRVLSTKRKARNARSTTRFSRKMLQIVGQTGIIISQGYLLLLHKPCYSYIKQCIPLFVSHIIISAPYVVNEPCIILI